MILHAKQNLIDFNKCEMTLFLALSDIHAFKNVCTENLYNVKMMSTRLLLSDVNFQKNNLLNILGNSQNNRLGTS